MKTKSLKNNSRLLNYVSAFALLASFTTQAQQWNFNGYSLQNNTTINSSPVNALHFFTAQQERMSMYPDGHIVVLAPYGQSIWDVNPSTIYTTMHVNGGQAPALAAYTQQSYDWGQCVQSLVSRKYTVSYVMNWNGADRFFVAGQGWLYANGAWFGSDANLKTNVTTLTNALDKVLSLRGVTYQWKPEELSPNAITNTVVETDTNRYLGFIAQEVEPIVPEVVRTMTNGTKAVSYHSLVALLVEAIKEQQGQIRDLQNRLQPSNTVALILHLQNPPPAAVQIQSSPDLSVWNDLGKAQLHDGSAQFDIGAATNRNNYFRAKAQ
jgi:hypothetical protein